VRYQVVSGVAEAARLARGSGAHWCRLGDRTVFWARTDEWEGFTRAARQAAVELGARAGRALQGRLHLIMQVGRCFQDAHPRLRIVLDKGRHLVADLTPADLRRLAGEDEVCWTVRQLPVDTVVIETVVRQPRAPAPWTQGLLTALSRSAYESHLTTLAALPTRHSLSSHYTAAAVWAADRLQRLGYAVAVQPVSVAGGSSSNVVADRAGQGGGIRELVLVTAHLDSINSSGGSSAAAPGADDNASGAAGVIEMARILATRPATHDLRCILFGGEEQGLHGSTQYVASLPAGERARVRAVINMDMVGTLNTASPTVLLEGAPISRTLMTMLADAAATYTGLAVQESLTPFASDHVPFINALLPAVLTIEGADRANANVHTANDVTAHIDYRLALDILRMNLAVTAAMIETAEEPTQIRMPRSGPVVAWGPGRLDVFVVGADSQLYHKAWDGHARSEARPL
jgi:Peptidase family M28